MQKNSLNEVKAESFERILAHDSDLMDDLEEDNEEIMEKAQELISCLEKPRDERVAIVVRNCKGLKKADLMGKSDPYVVLVHSDYEEKKWEKQLPSSRTTVINQTLDPVWEGEDGKITGKVPKDAQTLSLAVWDWDKRGSDDFLGIAEWPADRSAVGEAVEPMTVELKSRSGGKDKKISGSITFTLRWTDREALLEAREQLASAEKSYNNAIKAVPDFKKMLKLQKRLRKLDPIANKAKLAGRLICCGGFGEKLRGTPWGPCLYSLPEDSGSITAIATAKGFGLVLTDQQQVWVIGYGYGDHTFEGQQAPFIPEGLEAVKIAKVAACDGVAAAIDVEGNVWRWGCTSGEKNGLLPVIGELVKAEKMDIGERKAVDVDLHSSVLGWKQVKMTGGIVVTEDGTALTWGYAYPLQKIVDGEKVESEDCLAHTVESGDPLQPTPRVVMRTGPEGIIAVQGIAVRCGFGIRDKEGFVHMWGSHGTSGQKEEGDCKTTRRASVLPTKVPSVSNVVDLIGGSVHVLAVLEDGKMKTWGCVDCLDERSTASALGHVPSNSQMPHMKDGSHTPVNVVTWNGEGTDNGATQSRKTSPAKAKIVGSGYGGHIMLDQEDKTRGWGIYPAAGLSKYKRECRDRPLPILELEGIQATVLSRGGGEWSAMVTKPLSAELAAEAAAAEEEIQALLQRLQELQQRDMDRNKDYFYTDVKGVSVVGKPCVFTHRVRTLLDKPRDWMPTGLDDPSLVPVGAVGEDLYASELKFEDRPRSRKVLSISNVSKKKPKKKHSCTPQQSSSHHQPSSTPDDDVLFAVPSLLAVVVGCCIVALDGVVVVVLGCSYDILLAISGLCLCLVYLISGRLEACYYTYCEQTVAPFTVAPEEPVISKRSVVSIKEDGTVILLIRNPGKELVEGLVGRLAEKWDGLLY